MFSHTLLSYLVDWALLAHIGLIFAVYLTFKHFHRAEENSTSVF